MMLMSSFNQNNFSFLSTFLFYFIVDSIVFSRVSIYPSGKTNNGQQGIVSSNFCATEEVQKLCFLVPPFEKIKCLLAVLIECPNFNFSSLSLFFIFLINFYHCGIGRCIHWRPFVAFCRVLLSFLFNDRICFNAIYIKVQESFSK